MELSACAWTYTVTSASGVGLVSRQSDSALNRRGQYASYDAYLSDRIDKGLGMRLGRCVFRLPRSQSERQTDEVIENKLLEHILGAKLLDRVVVLAFDQYHTTTGQAVGRRQPGDSFATDLYVSNTYVRHLWRHHPQRILFGASIHPYRQMGAMSAVQMLDEVAAAGAVLIKWLPLTQNINAEDPRTVAFLRRAGEINMPMLIHYGGEWVLSNGHPEFEDPSALLRTLRGLRAQGKMPTVIVAHAATPGAWPFESARHFRVMADALLGEFADAPLYADLSGLGMINRAHWLKRLAAMPALHHKLVYGSDFPVPVVPLVFARKLGRRRRREISAVPSWIDRDIAVKSALGLGEPALIRSGELLRQRIAMADAMTQPQ